MKSASSRRVLNDLLLQVRQAYSHLLGMTRSHALIAYCQLVITSDGYSKEILLHQNHVRDTDQQPIALGYDLTGILLISGSGAVAIPPVQYAWDRVTRILAVKKTVNVRSDDRLLVQVVMVGDAVENNRLSIYFWGD